MKTFKKILLGLQAVILVVAAYLIYCVDVAQNPKTGKKAFLPAEGNTPARDIHILNNLEHPFRSPWFMLDEDTDDLLLSVFYYHADELKHF